jgi:hypothetical protein
MAKRYCEWHGKDMYYMSERQEQYLVDRGYEIIKPELRNWEGDPEVVDIPHFIPLDDKSMAGIRWDRDLGVFYIETYQHKFYDISDIKRLMDLITELTQLIAVLNLTLQGEGV